MSTRAHKVIEIQHEDVPTFNCSQHPQVLRYADNYDQYSDGGLLQYSRAAVENVLAIYDAENINDTASVLRMILNDMGDNDYVQYWCY